MKRIKTFKSSRIQFALSILLMWILFEFIEIISFLLSYTLHLYHYFQVILLMNFFTRKGRWKILLHFGSVLLKGGISKKKLQKLHKSINITLWGNVRTSWKWIRVEEGYRCILLLWLTSLSWSHILICQWLWIKWGNKNLVIEWDQQAIIF